MRTLILSLLLVAGLIQADITLRNHIHEELSLGRGHKHEAGSIYGELRRRHRHEAPVVAGDGMDNLSDRLTMDTRGLRAYPGAEGGGQFTVGGRGGDLFVVNDRGCTTVANDGKQTLSEGMQRLGDASGIGAIYITFDVGGLFPCLDVYDVPPADVTNAELNPSTWTVAGDTTVACQTAPAPGVHIAIYRVVIKQVDDVLVRGCHWYGLDAFPGNAAAMLRVTGPGDSTNIVMDRNSYRHGPDGNITMGYHSINSTFGTISNVTLSNSILAEADAYSTHEESKPGRSGQASYHMHATGGGCSSAVQTTTRNPVINCSIIGNVWPNLERRIPQMKGASGHIVGNFIYNPGSTGIMVNATTGDGSTTRSKNLDIHVVDNLILDGPNTDIDINGPERGGIGTNIPSTPTRQLSYSNNKRIYDDGTVYNFPDQAGSPDISRSLALADTLFHPVRDWVGSGLADLSVFNCLGPRLDHRDTDITRIFEEVRDGTGEIGIGPVYGNPDQPDGDHGRLYLTEDGSDIGGADVSGNDPVVVNSYAPDSQWPASHDTDSDGMDDAWEIANGLNVGLQDHNGDLDNDGYTNIEEYANYRMRCS